MLNRLTPVIKNILIINIALFVLKILAANFGINLNPLLSLHFYESESFLPFQFITYAFMHADFMHLFFNMFMVLMFGTILEKMWGAQKFIIFYFVCSIGAAILHMTIQAFEYQSLASQLTENQINEVYKIGYNILSDSRNFVDETLGKFNIVLNGAMLGASGAVFGIMFAFAYLFPNTELYFMFIPFPIKAKYAMGFMAVVELLFGIGNFDFDNVAHFAHLGGALFGFIMIKIWGKNKNNFY
jgi:membrane associated rhomboid family serine protease